MDIFALVRRRTLDALADLTDRGAPPGGPDLGRVAVAVPRVGAPGDVVVDVGPVRGQQPDLLREVARRLGAAPDVESVAAVGGGRLVVTLRQAAMLAAVAAMLDGRSPMPVLPTARGGAAPSNDPPRSAYGGASLADLRAEILADLRSTLARATGAEPRAAAADAAIPARLAPVVLHGAAHGARLDAGPVLALIGADAFRFAVASCRPNAALHLDLQVLGDRCRADPSFWVPYAHARARSVLRRAAATVPGIDPNPAGLAAADLSGLTDEGEAALARLVARHAQVVAEAAAAAAPYRLAAHLREVADAVHHQWNRSKDQPQLRFVNEERRDLTKARLGLVTASALVLRSGLGLLGLSAPDEML